MFQENLEFPEHLQKQDVHTWFIEDIPDIPGTCTAFVHVIGLFYFRYSAMCTSCRCSGNSAFSWDIYLDTGFSFLVFQTLHHGDALAFLGTFTHTPGLFVSGFCTAYGGCFLGLSKHYIMQMIRFFWGHWPGHQCCFLSGFPHSPGTCASFLHVCNIFIWDIDPWNYLCTSCRCSRFSWDI